MYLQVLDVSVFSVVKSTLIKMDQEAELNFQHLNHEFFVQDRRGLHGNEH